MRTTSFPCLTALATLTASASIAMAQVQEYELVIIEPWDQAYSLASSSVVGLNNRNEVSGCATPLTGLCSFLWTRETGKVPIDFAGRINDAGVIAGYGRIRYPDGTYETFDRMGNSRDLNESLVVAGSTGTANCMKHNNTEGAVWDPVNETILLYQDRGIWAADEARAINERNQIVGVRSSTGGCGDFEAFFYDLAADELFDIHELLVGSSLALTEVFDLNDASVVVGEGPDGLGSLGPFLWSPHRDFMFLPPIPGGTTMYTHARSINSFDEVVGEGIIGLFEWHAFIWDETKGIRNLNDVTPTPPDFVIDRASSINDNGWIIGSGHYGAWSPERAVVLIPVDGDRYGLIVNRLVADSDATVQVTNATPNETQYVVYSLRGRGSTDVPQLGVTIDLAQPSLAVSGPADAQGGFETTVHVPAIGSGRRVWLQAIELGRTTPAIERFIE